MARRGGREDVAEGRTGCRIRVRGEEGILDDSVISQGHTGLPMKMSTFRIINCKTTHRGK
jgi:hypothetical protein